MNARDIMTTDVVAVGANTPAREIARLLVENGISAVPVVDASGAPIGVVSEGDLIGRDEVDRVKRRDWWLEILAEGGADAQRLKAKFDPGNRLAHNIMSAPVITVDGSTDVSDIARLLSAYRIKRVPVVEEGRMVGIVSRADLVRVLAAEPPKPVTHHLEAAMSAHKPAPIPPKPSVEPGEAELTVEDLRSLVEHAKHEEAERREAERRASAEIQRRAVEELIAHHVTDESWRNILRRVRDAAERGENSFMLLRFPSALCSDGGRAINAPEPGWPATLRGEAAEIYLRWEQDLKPHGFRLTARVLDFPGGFPGDLGLFLIWED